jgi:predicted RND superfamily exporter protein
VEKFFSRLSELVMKKPVLTVFITILIMIGLITGVTRIWMATGNETFIKTDTDTYRNNLKLEEMFGGENILIRLKTADMADLLTVDNLTRIEKLESILLDNKNVYSVIGPASTVRHITAKQAENILTNVRSMRWGLAEMGEKLADISLTIKEMTDNTPTIDLSQTTGQFQQLSQTLHRLIAGQLQLQEGVGRLGSGYTEFAGVILIAASSIDQISSSLEESLQSLSVPEQEKQQILQKTVGLKQSAAVLNQAGSNMQKISGEAQFLSQVPMQTATGLTAMQEGLAAQSRQLETMQKQLPDIGNLSSLGEGLAAFSEKLLAISEGLGVLLETSNIMVPGMPTSQNTLDMILYDEGELRPLFAQMVIDNNNALMMVRLTGTSSDSRTEEVVTLISDFFAHTPLSNTHVTVTGKPVLDIALRTEMRRSMQRMVISALILMVVIVSLVFQVRWRLFPLIVNFAAVVATMGLMGHLGIPMTMVSMAAFPILIGLGIDYSIQFHSRYEEEFTSEEAVTYEA